MTEWMNNLIGSLERLIEKPPYLIFVFIGSILVIISLYLNFGYERAWIFFLYSVGGLIWRYAEKDLKSVFIKVNEKNDLIVRCIYHVGNIGLFILLIYFLYSI